MEVIIDPDVKAVAEFMQSRIETRKLCGVAESLRVIAPMLWGHYTSVPIKGIELVAEPIMHEPLSSAIESSPGQACVDDGFAVAEAN